MKIYTAPDVTFDEIKTSCVLQTSMIQDVFGLQGEGDETNEIW